MHRNERNTDRLGFPFSVLSRARIQAVETRLSWHAEQLEAAATAGDDDSETPPPRALYWAQTADDLAAGLDALVVQLSPRLAWAQRHRAALRRYAAGQDAAAAWHRRLLARCAASPCYAAIHRRVTAAAAGQDNTAWRAWWALVRFCPRFPLLFLGFPPG